MTSFADLLTASEVLPRDATGACLVGRIWAPELGGPRVVTIRDGRVVDLPAVATTTDIMEHDDPAAFVRGLEGADVGDVDALLRNTPLETRHVDRPWLLSPIDLQVVKAAGVTFPVSMLERVVEERAKGDKDAAMGIRREIDRVLGGSLASLRPGSPAALALKQHLIDLGWWSQYLEVGIGPDAEIFTKAPVLSTVGAGADVGVLSTSEWNNPEPEVVLVVSSRGRIVGAALGNDVNLRDVEGRSALLLPKAKDNNASAAVGPFVRLCDSSYGLDDIRASVVTLEVHGVDGFRLDASSPLGAISRDPIELVGQACGPHHQYPDGFVLYLGTLFAPTEDRDATGQGFTHRVGDMVRIADPRLGALVNRVAHAEELPPWTFGIAALHRYLSTRFREAR